MTELKTVIDFFENKHLNEVGSQLIDLYRKYNDDMQIAQQKAFSAIQRRFLAGKYMSENHDEIIEEMGTQRAFGERLGLSEATISNDKRGFESLAEEGITEVEDVIPFLKKKNISATTYSWERIGTMLNEPDSLKQKDNIPKDKKILEETEKNIRDVLSRNEGSTHNNIEAEAKQLLQYLEETKQHINKLDPYSYNWRSDGYKQWCRNLGICMLTKNPCTPEFHHTDQFGGSGGEGTKLPDMFGFPISPKIHAGIENGSYKVTDTQIATALIETMALFIANNYE